MTQTEALRLALEALKDRSSLMKWQKAITAVEAALEVPEEKYIYGTPLFDAMKGDKHDAD